MRCPGCGLTVGHKLWADGWLCEYAGDDSGPLFDGDSGSPVCAVPEPDDEEVSP